MQDVRKRLSRSLRKGVETSDLEHWPTETEIAIFARSTLPLHYTCEGHPRPSILSKIFKAIHKYSPVFDVFIQQQPFLAAIAWGTCRLLVQVRTHLSAPQARALDRSASSHFSASLRTNGPQYLMKSGCCFGHRIAGQDCIRVGRARSSCYSMRDRSQPPQVQRRVRLRQSSFHPDHYLPGQITRILLSIKTQAVVQSSFLE